VTDPHTERRAVRSEDPSLSPRANELLTRELQEALGTDEVVVPKDEPRRSRDEHATHSPLAATLASNRPILIVTFLAALVLGGIVALVTGAYWAVVLAAALHAIGTLIVAAGAIHLTTETEHVAPTVAARLEEEGVADPDRVLSELVEDFAGAREARGVAEVVSSGHNERTTAPDDDRARAAIEQRTALTPSSGATPAEGSRSAVAALEWWIVCALAVLSLVVGAIVGGEMWALPAVVVPLCAGWVALQHWMARGHATSQRSPASGAQSGVRRLAPVGAFVVAGVIWFMVVVGWIANLL
jgi:energy-converting hydrogenase Eha subunit C